MSSTTATKATEPEQFFLFPNSALESDKAEIHSLKHPKSEQACMVVFSDNKQTYEVRECKDDFRSWFLGQKVVQHGRLLMVTPVDAVLFMLPYVQEAGERNTFSPVEQILHDEEFPSTDRLIELQSRLTRICDCKTVDDSTYVRYSETKTLSWLRAKVERTANKLRELNFHVGPGYCVETCVSSTKTKDSIPEEYYLKYALGIVGDYVRNDLVEKLRIQMNIEDLEENVVNVVSPSIEVPSKKRKVEQPSEDYSSVLAPLNKQKQNLTAAQKKVAKIDKTGMKALTSFFTVKPKK